MKCAQELCGNWSGDGLVCPCALFDLEPDVAPAMCEWCGVRELDAIGQCPDWDDGRHPLDDEDEDD